MIKFVGIDPGIKTGFAVWDSKDKEFEAIKTLSIKDFFSIVSKLDISNYTFYIENPNHNRPLFSKRKDGKGQPEVIRIAQNVGTNKGIATSYIAYLNSIGAKVIEVTPSKSTFTKLNPERFAQITGIKSTTSEHARDAAMLVFGR